MLRGRVIDLVVGLVFLFSGLGLCYFLGYQEQRLRRASSAEPESLSLQQLIDRGPEGNPHVEVRDLRLLTGPGEYVAVTDASGRWQQVLLPAVPTEGPRPARVDVVVHSTRLRDLEGVQELARKPALQGLVVNDLGPMPGNVGEQLAQMYPDTDFATCVVLEEGRAPPSAGRGVAGWVGGVVFCVLGVLSLRRTRHR